MVASIAAALKADGEVIIEEHIKEINTPLTPGMCPNILPRAEIIGAFEQQGFRLVEGKKLKNNDWLFRFRRS